MCRFWLKFVVCSSDTFAHSALAVLFWSSLSWSQESFLSPQPVLPCGAGGTAVGLSMLLGRWWACWVDNASSFLGTTHLMPSASILFLLILFGDGHTYPGSLQPLGRNQEILSPVHLLLLHGEDQEMSDQLELECGQMSSALPEVLGGGSVDVSGSIVLSLLLGMDQWMNVLARSPQSLPFPSSARKEAFSPSPSVLPMTVGSSG